MRHFESGDIITPKEHLKDWLKWALRVDSIEGDGTIQAFPLGGGLVYTFGPISVEKFDFVKVPQKLLNSPNWKSVEFFAEWLDKKYRGWSNGLKWNGWAMPYFEFDEAMRYASDTNNTRFDPLKDAFVTKREDDGEEEIDEATVILVKGRGALKVYPIGAGSWTWSLAREEDQDDD
jgi:hypothetical protein